MQRLRTLSEAECYARCYGWRGDESVKVVKIEPRRPRDEALATGERPRDEALATGELLRSLFEDKLDSREPEAA